MRFEIEVKLIERQLTVADVPACWNEEFEKMFGLKVTKDADGCLQDIHWSMGTFGYFPTYTLGNLNAAQLMHRATLDCQGWRRSLGGENTRPCWRGYVRKFIGHGLRYQPAELMRRATGEPTSSVHHLDYFPEEIRGGLSCKNPRSLRLTISHRGTPKQKRGPKPAPESFW